MIDHILFFTYLPLTRKIEEDFYIRELIGAGYKVTYVDVSAMYLNKAGDIAEDREYVTKIRSFREFDALMASVAQKGRTLVIPILTFGYPVLRLFRIVSKYDMTLGFFARGMIPNPVLQKNMLQRIFSNFRSYLSIKRVIAFWQNKLAHCYKAAGKVRKYDVVFVAGKYGALTIGAGHNIDMKEARVVHINYFDYDKYLDLEKQHDPLITFPYCVFIDQCLPYHPDVKLFGLKEIDPDRYFRSLNAFFDEVEDKFKLKVVIAAHPKADYTHNPFNGRQVFKYKTAELIKHSSFALTHNSTSVSFGILYNKPIFILYNEEVGELFSKKQMEFLNEFIGGYFADTDFPAEVRQLDDLHVNAAKYESYKYSFLTSQESQERKTVDIFMDYLSNSRS